MKRTPSERAFMRKVLRFAKAHGWRVFHPAPARFGQAWRTPYAGDGQGFPDLVLVRPPQVLFVEVKVQGRAPTPAQRAWLTALGQCTEVRTAVWRESDWDAGVIQKILNPDAP